MLPSNVPNIPKDRVITYARVVVNHPPPKADPNRIQITAGGNLINYPGKLTTQTANITTAKLLWNSMLSTPRAKYMTLVSKTFVFLPRLTDSNTCASLLPFFPCGLSNNML
jgi:hypothetical protein